MTVSQLYSSVARLGFETFLEDNESFFLVANRALLQVNSIRPLKGKYVLYHNPPENIVQSSSFEPVLVEKEICFEGNDAKAYYFEADGAGVVKIEAFDESSDSWRTIGEFEFSANRSFVAYRGMIQKDEKFFNGRVRLRFAGDYLYSVRSVALYQSLYSGREEDIPAFEPFKRYDISKLVTDFLSLATPLIKRLPELTVLYEGYAVEDGRVVLLPYGERGIYEVLYHRRPQELIYNKDPSNDTDTVIELDEDLCALLPLLIAAYVWADDEPEKAQYYLTLYRERALDIERRYQDAIPATIKSVNDW